ncbi:Ribose 1,5-bisphosphate phosphokinase PhnN [Pandoraea terrae]|uniref:Ribose 1,5-bisphosphate phosphokinase PhnN n=1 Tax=Pandoraea terrae TaxID=1537710 RepID=A0A5E4WG25_9BURK|nr:phosphonate metabolism protein/1,5-bisphosphokinase (PRPP-forming) PhnN [Pandoraea terrae]VVE22514.1 Ribose 1,5-bisphosphate phosphokinase PhnN [Pandoraea terrae]
MNGGRLFYVMGPSGAGKDALLGYARERLGDSPASVLFAHRYITRPESAGGENHIALSLSEFAVRKAHGLFALDWDSHGCRYGVGIEIDTWLDAGCDVVMNGSRAHLSRAVKRYDGRLHLVVIHVDTAVRAARLASRGREAGEALAQRVAHAVEWTPPAGVPLTRIANNGTLAAAGETLVDLLVERST